MANDRSLADNETGAVVDKHTPLPIGTAGWISTAKTSETAALQEMRKLSPIIAPQPMADAVPLQTPGFFTFEEISMFESPNEETSPF